MNITRRNFALKTLGGVTALGVVGLQSSCFNATGFLQKVDAITKAANAVLTTLDNVICPNPTSCIAIPYVPLVTAWIATLEGANAKALAIANGTATLSPTQITDIIGIYAGALAFNIPGVPTAVTTVINAVIAAVDVLLSFLGAPASSIAAFKRNDLTSVRALVSNATTSLSSLPTNRGLLFKEHVRSSIKANNELGTHLATTTALLSEAKPSAALHMRSVPGVLPHNEALPAGSFGSGGYGK